MDGRHGSALGRRRGLPDADREPRQLHPAVPEWGVLSDGRRPGAAGRPGERSKGGTAVKTRHLIVAAVICTLAVVEFAVARDVPLDGGATLLSGHRPDPTST